MSEATPAERAILRGEAPLVSKEEELKWFAGLWAPPRPPPLRRVRVGYSGVPVGDAKRPGPGGAAGLAILTMQSVPVGAAGCAQAEVLAAGNH